MDFFHTRYFITFPLTPHRSFILIQIISYILLLENKDLVFSQSNMLELNSVL